jgi:hypothetical protein
LRPEWVEECEGIHGVAPLARKFVFVASAELESELLRDTDIYGDSWTQEATPRSLDACLENMVASESRGELAVPVQEDDPDFEANVSASTAKMMESAGLWGWGITFCVVDSPGATPLTAAVAELEFAGAKIVLDNFRETSVSASATHILIRSLVSKGRVRDAQPAARLAVSDAVIVSNMWVRACTMAGQAITPFV